MKQPYLYFGRKGYYAFPAIADGDHTGTPVTNDLGFMVPANKAVSVDASAYLQLSHRCVDAVASGVRSAIVVANGPRPGTPAFSGSPTNHVAGEVAILDNKEALLVESTGELTVTLVGTDGGITATANDFLYLEEIAFNPSVGPFNATTSDVCLPASSFISAQPVAYTAAGGVHWDLAAQDQTKLIFKPLKPQTGGGVITINIVHTADKYKEVCEAMQELCNSSVYEEMIKVHHMTPGGQVVHNAFSSRGITIYGMNIT